MKIENKFIDKDSKAYFIADIAANHDGDIERAKDLIYLAAEAGSDAAKFQHFTAETIISKYGFDALKRNMSHQKDWKKSVFEVYKDASVDLKWTETLVETCKKANISFFTTPYSLEVVDYIDSFVPAFKIGSGDITWHEIIKKVASKNKPYIIASGASSIDEVDMAVSVALKENNDLCLMQCNTNYTASIENFKYINLNVLKTFQKKYPQLILGLSDHTPGHTTVLGAITLGAKIIEKHFTDDNERDGPDHKFSMNPKTWKEMVFKTRELEDALGYGVKKLEKNEYETVVLQRRAIRAASDLSIGTLISNKNTFPLRPCPKDGIPPYKIDEIEGKSLNKNIKKGDLIRISDLS